MMRGKLETVSLRDLLGDPRSASRGLRIGILVFAVMELSVLAVILWKLLG